MPKHPIHNSSFETQQRRPLKQVLTTWKHTWECKGEEMADEAWARVSLLKENHQSRPPSPSPAYQQLDQRLVCTKFPMPTIISYSQYFPTSATARPLAFSEPVMVTSHWSSPNSATCEQLSSHQNQVNFETGHSLLLQHHFSPLSPS